MGQPTELTRLIDSLAAKLPYVAPESVRDRLTEYMTAAFSCGVSDEQARSAKSGSIQLDGMPRIDAEREISAILGRHDAQIASLQQAVAAIERRQMPLRVVPDPKVLALQELARDCDNAQRRVLALTRIHKRALMDDERKELEDLAVSLGDASALASKTAREST